MLRWGDQYTYPAADRDVCTIYDIEKWFLAPDTIILGAQLTNLYGSEAGWFAKRMPMCFATLVAQV